MLLDQIDDKREDVSQIGITDPDYFLDEEKDGFLIESMMKRLWATDVKELLVLKEICDRYGIRFSLAGGSLLGAIRNGGHIPWDDDLDVEMKRADYHRAVESGLLNDLPRPYWISDERFSGNGYEIKKLVNSESYNLTTDEMKQSFGFPFANLIDIFMLDFIPSDPNEQDAFFKIIDICEIIRCDADADPRVNKERYDERREQLENLFGYRIDIKDDESLDYVVLKYLDEFFLEYNKDNSTDLSLIYFFINKSMYRYPARLYEKYLEIAFEGEKVYVPAGYDGILRRNFGKYMFPVMDTAYHDYPSYRYHIGKLAENGIEYPEYHIDPDAFSELMQYSRHDSNMISIDNGNYGTHESENTCNKINTESKLSDKDKSVVFLCVRGMDFRGLDELYRIVSDSSCSVTVITVSYRYIGFDGKPCGELINDAHMLPDDIMVTPTDNYDFTIKRPDIVIYQWPYDEWNGAISVDKKYHAASIRKYTKKMVLIPPFILRDIQPGDVSSRYALGRWIKTPGFVLADIIVAQSENIKAVMEEIIKEFTENEEISDLYGTPGDRIICEGNPLQDVEISKDYSLIPSEWSDKLKNDENTYKKVLALYLSPSVVYEHGFEAIEKIRQDIAVINNHIDRLALWWVCDPNMDEVLSYDYDLRNFYSDLIDELQSYGNIVFDDTYDMGRVLNICDGFFGDGCPLMNEFRIAKKPVLWETPWEFQGNNAPDAANDKVWSDEVLIAVEGEWSIDCFIKEFLSYQKKQRLHSVARRIFEQII